MVIDRVKPGAGTSNTGNVARAFFSDPSKTSSITGIDINLITNLQYMLIALNSGYFINTDKFSKIG